MFNDYLKRCKNYYYFTHSQWSPCLLFMDTGDAHTKETRLCFCGSSRLSEVGPVLLCLVTTCHLYYQSVWLFSPGLCEESDVKLLGASGITLQFSVWKAPPRAPPSSHITNEKNMHRLETGIFLANFFSFFHVIFGKVWESSWDEWLCIITLF